MKLNKSQLARLGMMLSILMSQSLTAYRNIIVTGRLADYDAGGETRRRDVFYVDPTSPSEGITVVTKAYWPVRPWDRTVPRIQIHAFGPVKGLYYLALIDVSIADVEEFLHNPALFEKLAANVWARCRQSAANELAGRRRAERQERERQMKREQAKEWDWVLVTLNAQYSDEFEVGTWSVVHGEEWAEYVQGLLALTYPAKLWIGSERNIEFDSPKKMLDAHELIKITAEEAAVIKKYAKQLNGSPLSFPDLL